MIIFRLVHSKFKDDFSGEGARLYGGRWNSVGNSMLYGSEHISLSLLEVLVNKRTNELFEASFHLLEMYIPDSEIKVLSTKDMKLAWQDDYDYSQFIGDHFLQDSSIWVLKVPSAVVPEEHNFLINPIHQNFSSLVLKESKRYKMDSRVFG